MLRSYGFRQSEIEQNCIREGQRGRKKKRHVNSPAAENAADRRSKDKPESKGSAEQSHSFGAVFFSCDIGDVRLRSGDIPTRDAIQNPSQKKHPQSVGKA